MEEVCLFHFFVYFLVFKWKLWLVNIFSLMHVRKDSFREKKKVKSVLGKYFQFPNLYLGVLVFWLLRIKSWFAICFQLQFFIFYFYYSVLHLKLNQKIIYLIKPTIHPSPSTSHHKPTGHRTHHSKTKTITTNTISNINNPQQIQ